MAQLVRGDDELAESPFPRADFHRSALANPHDDHQKDRRPGTEYHNAEYARGECEIADPETPRMPESLSIGWRSNRSGPTERHRSVDDHARLYYALRDE
jgi:hypothetical protein